VWQRNESQAGVTGWVFLCLCVWFGNNDLASLNEAVLAGGAVCVCARVVAALCKRGGGDASATLLKIATNIKRHAQ